MQSKHTPGPWVVDEKPGDSAGAVRIIGATGAVVALMKAAGGRKQANAALTAEAPAMLEALRAVVALAELHIAERSKTPEEESEFLSCAYLVNARAILARIDAPSAI